nr:hypothetical protein CFP56_04625 [Quercus suber]
MAPDLFWVHKSSGSDALSRSAKLETTGIRRHVQTTRRANHKITSSRATVRSFENDDRPGESKLQEQTQNAALSLALRPNTALGRMRMTEVAVSSTEPRDRSGSRTKTTSRMTRAVRLGELSKLSPSIPWMWQSFRPDERSRLAFFELRTSQDWSGWQDAPFWKTLVLPLSHQSRAVARSLIALSALHESIEVADESYRSRLCYMSSSHGDRMIKEIASSDITYFEALVSCVIVLCFQSIQGSKSSFRLLRSGLRLLEQRKDRVSVGEEDLIRSHVRPIFDLLCCRPSRMGDLPGSLVLSVRHLRSQTVDGCRPSRPTVPAGFQTTLEARDCLQRILDWGHDTVEPCYSHDPSAYSFTQSLRQLRLLWETAVQTIPRQGTVLGSSNIDKASRLLRAACILGYILLQTFDTQQEVVYDDYLSDFDTILDLVEEAVSSPDSRSHDISFGIDGGLVDMIKFVGVKCRDPAIRRRALWMLCSRGRAEGDRIASTPGEILKIHIDLEERRFPVSSCEDVPESNRWRLLVGHQLFRERKIELFFIASPYEPGPDAIVEKRQISLPGPFEEPLDDSTSSVTPDTIFGSGYVEYLDDRASQQYFRLDLERFRFLIPRG